MIINFDKESNRYTIIFSTLVIIIVGGILAFLAEFLKIEINNNISLEKKMNLLQSLGVYAKNRSIHQLYQKYIIKELAVDYRGNEILSGKKCFDINLFKESKFPIVSQKFPLYLAKNLNNEKLYIIPLIGNGLWDIIWGYIVLDKKFIIRGVFFDHKGETPGLGAEINQHYFQNRFIGEKILDINDNFVGIDVIKHNNDPKNQNKEDHKVDAISGATITSLGVSNMIKNRIILYIPFLNKQKNNS